MNMTRNNMIYTKELEYGSGYGQYFDVDNNTFHLPTYEEETQEELYMDYLDREEQMMNYENTYNIIQEFQTMDFLDFSWSFFVFLGFPW